MGSKISILFLLLTSLLMVHASHDAPEPMLTSLELEIRTIETLLLQKTHEYLACAKQFSAERKQRYQELCRELLADLIVQFNQEGISPDPIPDSYVLGAPLTSPDAYLITIVDPREAVERHIGEAASSWKYNQFFGTVLPDIFITLPQPGCGTTLGTRYLSSTGELKPLLAHEIGHLWRFHDHEMNRCMDRWNTYLYIMAGIVAGASITGLYLYGKDSFAETYERYPRLMMTTGIGSVAALLAGITILHAKVRQLSRHQELEADQFIAALGDSGLQQFVTTLMRWHLNELLAQVVQPKTWFYNTMNYALKAMNYVKKRVFGTHPSHMQRLFHVVVTWRAMKLKKLCATHTEHDALAQAQQEVAELCHQALTSVPELQLNNLTATLQANFPNKSFSEEDKRLVVVILTKAAADFYKVIDKALKYTAPA